MALMGTAAMILSFDVAPDAVDEHDDWHTHEHLPERLSIPGFLRGTRWVAEHGRPRYFVTYEVKELATLTVPTLTIGARYDTMDPKHMEWMAKSVRNGRYLYCPQGSHLALYDDQKVYVEGLIAFIRDVDAGAFPAQRR